MPKMTSLNQTGDHKILGYGPEHAIAQISSISRGVGSDQAGYALVALLAMMTIFALFAMAVAPGIHQQAERDREKEAIFRGEQIADAIKEYYRYRAAVNSVRGDQALPTSMDQLIEGVPIPGGAKKRQIVRASAIRDPLTLEGEWRLIHPRSQPLIDFQQAVMVYAGTVLPAPRDPQMAQLQLFAAPQMTSILNTGTTSTPSSSSSVDDDSTGPFVGVASRSRRSSVLTYYGIDAHDGWVFTPLFRN
jgi:type II secretory pathway pseudopilin PulG